MPPAAACPPEALRAWLAVMTSVAWACLEPFFAPSLGLMREGAGRRVEDAAALADPTLAAVAAIAAVGVAAIAAEVPEAAAAPPLALPPTPPRPPKPLSPDWPRNSRSPR